MLYNGFKQDARQTIKQFPMLFKWHTKYIAYLLTIFPDLTSFLAYSYSSLKRKLGLTKQVTRNYSRKEVKKYIQQIQQEQS